MTKNLENETPRISLKSKHVKGSFLVANRLEMLDLLPKNSVVAEIGVDQGEFSKKILEVCRPKKLELIDIWGSTRYDQSKADLVAKNFSSEVSENRIKITRRLSIDAAGQFEDNYFDWIYLDTDHSYKTTRDELYAYRDKVKLNGFIAGHDYTMGNWSSGYKYGVIEAVSEFCVKENWKIFCLTVDWTESPSFAIQRIS
jgi:hypothetical protein